MRLIRNPADKDKTGFKARAFRWFLPGVVFFLIHASLIAHHTYISASKFDTVKAPPQPEFFGRTPVGMWSNAFSLNRWDALIYEAIAREGYPPPDSSGQVSYRLAWFPGYPLLARAVARVTGLSISPTLTLISAIGTLSFWVLLWSPPLRRTLGNRALFIVSMLTLTWPGAFFWFAGMTESLVSLMTLALIVAWISDRGIAALVLCGLATGIKQLFAPIGLFLALLRSLRNRQGPLKLLLWLFTAWSGLLVYTLFCWIRHDDPFAYTHAAYTIYEKAATLRALVDLPHLVRHARSLNGGSAVFALGFAIVTAVLWLTGRGWKDRIRKIFEGEIPLSAFLWAIGTASTVLYLSFDAYGIDCFVSMFRYQTTNIAHFLLAAHLLDRVRTRTLFLLFLPLAALGLYWQNELTVRYWLWWWGS